MNYSGTIERSIRYIEDHIREPISVRELASAAGYSLYHFCRVFAAIQGVPPGDYIRNRRLSLARVLLMEGHKVIDVAVSFGFETASGFSKAFRREFGYSPTSYLTRMSGWQAGHSSIMGGFRMNPVMKKRPAFKVAGYGIETNVASGYMKDIAAYWDHYTGENLESRMYRQLCPPRHGEVGLCVPSSADGCVTYLLGVIVDDFSKVTSDMLTAEVPAAEYAVFTTLPVDLSSDSEQQPDPLSLAVKSTWKYIFEDWFPNSAYAYDESGLDFEFYDERCHGCADSVMEIHIPIRLK